MLHIASQPAMLPNNGLNIPNIVKQNNLHHVSYPTTYVQPSQQPMQCNIDRQHANVSDFEFDKTEPRQKSPHAWQVVNYGSKKRKLSIPTDGPFSSKNQINVSNRFNVLSNSSDHGNPEYDEGNQQQQQNTVKPPPIFIHGVVDFEAMTHNLTNVLEVEQYTSKTLVDNVVKINTTTSESYRKLVKHLDEEKIIFHTYQLRDERAYRVVIRNIHPTVKPEQIEGELANMGHKVRNVMNVRHRVNKTPLPLFFVDLEPAHNNKEIYNLRYILQTQVTVEPPRKKNVIIQCTRCQSYGHSKTYCRKPFVCVKCGGYHNSTTCVKPRQTPAKCALCDGPHPANYKGCSIYQLLQSKRGLKIATPRLEMEQVQLTPTAPRNVNRSPLASYAAVVGSRQQGATQCQESSDISLSQFLSKFEDMFSQLMQQNTMIINLLTSMINNTSH